MVQAVIDEVVKWVELWNRDVLNDDELQSQLCTLLNPRYSDEILKWAHLWRSGALSHSEFNAQVSKFFAENEPFADPGGARMVVAGFRIHCPPF